VTSVPAGTDRRKLKCCGGSTDGRSDTQHDPHCPSIVRAALSWIEESSIGESHRKRGLAVFEAILANRDYLNGVLVDAAEYLCEPEPHDALCGCTKPGDSGTCIFADWLAASSVSASTDEGACSECGRNLHGYRGPRCRYCDGTAE
jgi:hypothetical protein